MRPVRLELEGFGVFRERCVVDLADADLFAIVGPTGHGKSTIIDGICFALYGKVPRHGDRDIAPAISLGVAEAKVSFTFELADRQYVATRIVRRKTAGGATTRAVRLEAVAADGTTEVLAASVGEAEPAVRELIGLDFDQFTKCVVLPQGRFAAFLQARPGERTAILATLLDLGRYDRMAASARDRAKQAVGSRTALEAELRRLDGADADALERARVRASSLGTLERDLHGALANEAALVDTEAHARADAKRARAAISALTAVHVSRDVERVAEELDGARAKERTTRLALAETERRLEELDELAGDGDEVAALAAAVDAHKTRAALADRIGTGERAHGELAAAAQVARDALVAAEEDVAVAETAAAAAASEHAHAELRAGLVVGEACPVCEQVVAKRPKRLSQAAATKARTGLETRRRAQRTAQEQARAALRSLDKADALLEELRAQLAELDRRIAVHPDRAATEHRLVELRGATDAAREVRRDVTAKRKQLDAETARITKFEQLQLRAAGELQTQRDALVSSGLTPPPETTAHVLDRWRALASWAVDALPDQEKLVAEQEDAARAAAAERTALVGELAMRAKELGVDARVHSLGELAQPVIGAQRDAEHAVEHLARCLERARDLAAEIRAAHRDEQVAATLARLLDKAHFGQWLVDEALQGLVATASVTLRQLSADQYSLSVADDGELVVVDHVNADETRSVRSLSGGETFQASLALALALADGIAELTERGTAALEAIFLDEGFGALDPESLDIVAGTVEALGGDRRVVGVVTHVAELAERMPVRLRVHKEGRAATVTRDET
jgi:exonuclease SbcC